MPDRATEDADAVLVIGEALVDVVHRADGTSAEHPGGSPLNVAIGLARLGRDTHRVTRLGEDARGRAVVRLLEASGVLYVAAAVLPVLTAAHVGVVPADVSVA